jgi:hypothetical protein
MVSNEPLILDMNAGWVAFVSVPSPDSGTIMTEAAGKVNTFFNKTAGNYDYVTG